MQDRRTGADRRAKPRRAGDTQGLSAYGAMAESTRRDELVTRHLRLVHYIVSRLAIGLPSWMDRRDLVSSGVVGLIDAAKQFDPSKGVKFETYAANRIRGAIIDELRALDWVPRSVRDKAKEIENAIAVIAERLGRLPTDMETAVELGWDLSRLHKAMEEVSGTTLVSLDEIIATSSNGDSVRRIDTIEGEKARVLNDMERRELQENIARIISGLSEQERLVMALYYYEELTLKEIGMVIKVTESRVSQIHTAAILKIRARLRVLYSVP